MSKQNKNKLYLAIYGTLKHALKDHIECEDTIYNYKKYMVKGHPFPAAIYEKGESIKVNVAHVDERILRQCDVYEGSLYRREEVITDSGLTVFMYVWCESPNYLEEI